MPHEQLQPVPYTAHDPACAVVALTPADQAHMHTYYDLCPWSPSGRLVASLRLPFEDHLPAPDDEAEVCVIDLAEGTLRPVWRTSGWGFQTAAHQQWGRTDRFLYFNDKRDDRPVGVRLDLSSGEAKILDGPVWQVSPDETFAVSPCLIRANLTQPGYGVTVRREHELFNMARAAGDDGLFRVDLATGEQTLLVPLEAVWEALPHRDDLADAVLYAFHVKFNPQGTRILLVVRARGADGKYVASLVTFAADGSDIRTAVSHRAWRRGGHHPIWYGDGERVLMCLVPPGESTMYFCLIDARTGEVTKLVDSPPGTGHPIVNPQMTHLVTDATGEQSGVRSVGVRLVDLPGGQWRDICRAESPAAGGEMTPARRDAHITWDRAGRRVLFLAAPAGRRQLFIADPALPAGAEPPLVSD